jgi:hypothetical protein
MPESIQCQICKKKYKMCTLCFKYVSDKLYDSQYECILAHEKICTINFDTIGVPICFHCDKNLEYIISNKNKKSPIKIYDYLINIEQCITKINKKLVDQKIDNKNKINKLVKKQNKILYEIINTNKNINSQQFKILSELKFVSIQISSLKLIVFFIIFFFFLFIIIL